LDVLLCKKIILGKLQRQSLAKDIQLSGEHSHV